MPGYVVKIDAGLILAYSVFRTYRIFTSAHHFRTSVEALFQLGLDTSTVRLQNTIISTTTSTTTTTRQHLVLHTTVLIMFHSHTWVHGTQYVCQWAKVMSPKSEWTRLRLSVCPNAFPSSNSVDISHLISGSTWEKIVEMIRDPSPVYRYPNELTTW